jgi:hypothetical protein
MSPKLRTAAAVAAATLALSLLPPATASALEESSYSMDVLVNGVPLSEYRARGTTYVEAQPDAEYELRLRNNTPRRVAIALSVDGLNSIDARTTSARDGRKWVLDPWQTITISGWQTDSQNARRFFFTTEERSYGAWLGHTADLGVIEAVVFRERERRPIVTEKEQAAPQRRDRSAGEAPRQPAAESSRAQPKGAYQPAPNDDYAATGIGREVSNPVYQVRFEAEPRPAAQLRVRYEYRPQLVRLGVLPPPWPVDTLDRREQARGFCPDPYDR